MKAILNTILIASLVFIPCCFAKRLPQAQPQGLNDDDYQIYSEVIKQDFVGFYGVVREIADRGTVVADRTLTLPPGGAQPKGIPGIKHISRDGNLVRWLQPARRARRDTKLSLAADDFNEKNKTSVTVENKFSIKVTMSSFDADPAGVIKVSRIGFNPNRTEAFVYVQRGHGYADNGGGSIYLMAKQNDGTWIIEGRHSLWAG